jgi:hypothetical protein
MLSEKVIASALRDYRLGDGFETIAMWYGISRRHVNWCIDEEKRRERRTKMMALVGDDAAPSNCISGNGERRPSSLRGVRRPRRAGAPTG